VRSRGLVRDGDGRGAAADDRGAPPRHGLPRPARPRRRGRLDEPRRRLRARPPEAVDPRPGRRGPAHGDPRRPPAHRLQRGDLQLRRAAPGPRGGGGDVRHPQRHRGPPPPRRPSRRRRRGVAPGAVRVRGLRREGAEPAPRPGRARGEAALHRAPRRPALLREHPRRALRPGRPAPRPRPRGGLPLPLLLLRPLPLDRLARGAEAPLGPPPHRGPPRGRGAGDVVDAACPGDLPRLLRGRRRGAPRGAADGDAPPPPRRRPRRALPLERARLRRRRGRRRRGRGRRAGLHAPAPRRDLRRVGRRRPHREAPRPRRRGPRRPRAPRTSARCSRPTASPSATPRRR
jgi:hypothetical protein